jgi:hypothetical protein
VREHDGLRFLRRSQGARDISCGAGSWRYVPMPTTVYVGNYGMFPHTVGFSIFLSCLLFVRCLLVLPSASPILWPHPYRIDARD